MTETRPISILIAALGGEGGGVLTNWIVDAAESLGFPVQSTSIPGVAQRTGATTYYIEIYPVAAAALGGKRPIMALMPAPGDLDLLLASELAEAARMISSGFVTAARTSVIAATGRSYMMTEKTAMADGRLDSAELSAVLKRHAKMALMLDMEAIAKAAGAMINAVMLGALAGSELLPIPAEAFAKAIAGEGKAAEANLAGFRAGLKMAQRGVSDAPRVEGKAWRPKAKSGSRRTLAELETEAALLPAAARDLVTEGLRRLRDYQDVAYARHYLDRLRAVAAVDQSSGRLLAETARHLALRMSFEDVIRVAQVKADPVRLARIRADLGAKSNEPVRVTEFFKPGIEELCSILPARLGRKLRDHAERRGWLGRVYWGMEIKTTTVSGYLRLRLLAAMRRWRRKTYRFQAEQREIEAWLAAIVEAAKISPGLALEICACATLIKGYGDTHLRGTANYRMIFERVARPALARRLDPSVASDALASARAAALADPAGGKLEATLIEIDRRATIAAAAE